MTAEEIQQLLNRYKTGQCSPAEIDLLEESLMHYNEQGIDLSERPIKAIGAKIYAQLPQKPQSKPNPKLWLYMSSAAAAVILSISLWFLLPSKTSTDRSLITAEKIYPAGNRATITLASGQQLQLATQQKEVIIAQNTISYPDGSILNNTKTTCNQTITTPKGGEYKIVLSDGTKVWLNAATVLQYPTSFQERSERRVKLVSGEAYFEVAKDKNHPFIVTTATQELEVLGTQFNINAYRAPIRTTLEEGSVKLNHLGNKNSVKLIPGEEASNENGEFKKSVADVELALAWKNGKLKFKNASLKAILDEAERWYGISVKYQGVIPEIHLTGGISRKSSLATLLKLLTMSGVNFSIKEERGINILVIKS
ncbi:FecR domain-containing protein [Pedobacter aquatilis]|uniref:FecR family protein n=1 Tax=Pedobacter aquatilis TaxID=351343 RepID=UPI0025B3EC27|nr:FecR family protein [Pedobacter aquatilis]MDN3588057.1 FecR domain-containing protein [Pedobacter aquatilis]